MKPRLAFALPLVLLLTACDGVYSPNPIGDEALPLDVAEWQGIWLQGEIVMLTTVLDAENGLLQVAWLERGRDGARYEVLSGEVRRSGEMVFLNVLDEPDEAGGEGAGGAEHPGETGSAPPAVAAAPLYWWARARSEGSRVTMWWPNVEAFRVAVRAGKLPGTVRDDDNVVLGTLTAEHLALIGAPELGLLDWQDPVVFVRIGN